jgi:hypothetical protein
MAVYVKFYKFVEDVLQKVHDLIGTDDTMKIVLTNSDPDVATATVLANITQISGINGYVTGGEDIQNNGSRSSGTVTITAVDTPWTASGSMGPFRYVASYNDTPTSPADPLVSKWDYGSNLTLGLGESFTADFGAAFATLA